MRVLIISQYFPPDMGGGATRAHNVAVGLVRAGCEVTVVSAAPHYPTGSIPKKYRWKPLCVEYDSGMKIIRTFVPPMESRGFARRIVLFLSFVLSSLFAIPLVGKTDVVFAANPNIAAMFAGLVYKKLSRCPLVQNVDDLWPEALYDLGVNPKSTLSRLAEAVSRIAYSLSSVITPISPGYVDVLSKKYEVDLRRIHVVPAGVEIAKFLETPARSEINLDDSFDVLYIGAFSPAYDFDQVFSAADLLPSNSKIRFTIQGGGEIAEYLLKRMKRSRNKNVQVWEMIVSRAEVARRLASADALLLPLSGIGSIELGISSKLYEYQAASKPIICCSSGNPGQYVNETRSGIVVCPGDHTALAEAVMYLKENPDIAEEMGRNGRDFVMRNLTTECVGEMMKSLFSKYA